ncbi:hypothetical protein [Paenibacillus taiwanensis]|uniref:hypothetical protein n=1 Tax=Paenibacillus taiwanensis TaxID=401638 RepID=UPI0003FB09BB|nr:hypothetical protein [Paenibacillus taiwanensis]
MNTQNDPSQLYKLSDIRRYTEQLWAGMKYDIMARGYRYYKEIAAQFSQAKSVADYEQIQVDLLYTQHHIPYSPAGLRTSIEHMWGYVSKHVSLEERIQYEALLQNGLAAKDDKVYDSALFLPESWLPVVQWLALMADQYHSSYLQHTFKNSFFGRTSR